MADIKNMLIKFIYEQIKLSRYKYTIIKGVDDLKYLKKNPHYVGFNYYGKNNLLIFTKISDSYYSFFVDRLTLSYEYDTVDMSKVNINQVNLEVHKDLYMNTILDGILNKVNGKATFVITDAYVVSAQSCISMEYKDKMNHIKEKILPKIKMTGKTDNIQLLCEDLYVYKDLPIITNYVENAIYSANKLKTRGLIFYPNKSGTRRMFILNKDNSVMPDTPSGVPSGVPPKSGQKQGASVAVDDKQYKKTPILNIATMLMRKTNKTDVYYLFLRQTKKKFENIGIAYVGTMKISKLCKSFFGSKQNDVKAKPKPGPKPKPKAQPKAKQKAKEKSSSESESESSESSSSEDVSGSDSEDTPKKDDIKEIQRNNERVVKCEWIPAFKKWQPVELSKNEINFTDDVYE